jgi:undecaprenyl-diphosphatase
MAYLHWIDQRLFQTLNSIAGLSSASDAVILFFAEYFSFFLIALFFLLLYFSHHAWQEKLHILFVAFISSLIARFGITELIRFFYHRPRPYLVLSAHALILETTYSFPSGHATFFFAMAAAIYLYNKKWGMWFFISTVMISISRVIAGVHYPSDIIGGMIIGIAVGYSIFYIAKQVFTKKL